jgi:two-component system sensor kinase FixL
LFKQNTGDIVVLTVCSQGERMMETVRQSRPPRSYLLYFIGVFLLAEACLAGLDLYYLYGQNGTVRDFLFDFFVTSGIILALVVLTYFALRKILVRYMDSTTRFSELAGLLPEGVVEHDLDGMVTYANELAVNWFGYEASDIEGRNLNILDVLVLEDRDRAFNNASILLRGGKVGPTEYRVKKKNGDVFTVLISSSLVERGGRNVGIRVVATDISEQKNAEAKLRDSEEKYRSLFESSIDGILVLTLSTGRITEANPAFLKMVGYTLDELIEKTYVELTPSCWHPLEMQIFRDQVATRGYSDEYEKEIIARDGTIIPVSVRRWVMKDDSGKPIGAWGILRDITEKKSREAEIERVNAELLGYAHAVSHDLKSPIHEVLMASETVRMLVARPQTEEVELYLEESFAILEHGLSRANNLIESMLALAESGQEPREVSRVNISETVDEIISERASDIEIRNIEVRPDEDLGEIIASPTHVYQVFSNLLKNAIVHGDCDKPVIEIRSLGGTGSEHRFLVRDNGPGIPENLIDDVFMPFTRGDFSDTGIGLSIVQKISEVYKGSVRAYNDSGACLEITLYDYSKS